MTSCSASSPTRYPPNGPIRRAAVSIAGSLEHNNHAGFPETVHAALSADENLAKQIAHALVDAHFPASLHAEILESASTGLKV